jgi:phosphohistidine phosphatase
MSPVGSEASDKHMDMVSAKQVVVVRHAVAEEAQADQPDAQRALTVKGKKKMAKGARGLRNIFPHADFIAHSPLLRARQTAEILATSYPGISLHEATVLSPGKGAAALNAWLRQQPVDRLILVGHEPDLSRWLCVVLSGRRKAFVEFGKASACLVEMPSRPGQARLEWFLTPDLLRALRK